MNYSFITSKDVAHNGKTKFYYVAHGDDIERFRSILDTLFEIDDGLAAVYTEKSEVPADPAEHFSVLSEMRFLIIPVTSSLLDGGEPLSLAEARFAVENKIPLIPFMEEEGLAEKYGEVFGSLQYIDRFDHDPTAIPYAEKLRGRISALLLANREMSNILSALPITAFLSYRKKDRRYVESLMRALHSYPALRDVGVWYDEFITPGERFDDEIDGVLSSSSAMLLMVTPDVLEDGNYVKTVEYPTAKRLSIPTLPVELSHTDRAGLFAAYPDISEPVSVTDAAASLARLLSLGEPSSDPEHLYYVGLAYLNGIRVERDAERATELITLAAVGGVIDAAEQLSCMYRFGIGVDKNYDSAVKWQERAVELCREQLSITEGTEYAGSAKRRYILERSELASLIRSEEQEPPATKCEGAIAREARKLLSDSREPKDLRVLIYVTRELLDSGDFYYDLDEAANFALECAELLFDIDPSDSAELLLAEALTGVAERYRPAANPRCDEDIESADREKRAGVRDMADRAFDIVSRLEKGGSVEVFGAKKRVTLLLGRLLLMDKDNRNAATCFEESVKAALNTGSRFQYTVHVATVSELMVRAGLTEECRKMLVEAIKPLREDDPEDMYPRADISSRLSILYGITGSLWACNATFTLASNNWRRLLRTRYLNYYKEQYREFLTRFAEFYREKGEYERELRALELLEELGAGESASALCKRAINALDLNKLDEAEEFILRALEQDLPNRITDYDPELSEMLVVRARVEFLKGDCLRSADLCIAAMAAAIGAGGDCQRERFVEAARALAVIYSDCGKKELAKAAYTVGTYFYYGRDSSSPHIIRYRPDDRRYSTECSKIDSVPDYSGLARVIFELIPRVEEKFFRELSDVRLDALGVTLRALAAVVYERNMNKLDAMECYVDAYRALGKLSDVDRMGELMLLTRRAHRMGAPELGRDSCLELEPLIDRLCKEGCAKAVECLPEHLSYFGEYLYSADPHRVIEKLSRFAERDLEDENSTRVRLYLGLSYYVAGVLDKALGILREFVCAEREIGVGRCIEVLEAVVNISSKLKSEDERRQYSLLLALLCERARADLKGFFDDLEAVDLPEFSRLLFLATPIFLEYPDEFDEEVSAQLVEDWAALLSALPEGDFKLDVAEARSLCLSLLGIFSSDRRDEILHLLDALDTDGEE